ADSIAWGWNVGFMWSPTENFRVGVSYRSKITHDAEGDLTIDHPDATASMMLQNSGLFGTFDGFATVTAPAWAMASVAWDVNDLVSLYGTFRWTDWSSFDKLDITSNHVANIPNPTNPTQTVPYPVGDTVVNKWRDTYLGSLGMDLRLTDWWTLRGGIAYESSPIANPQYRTAIIPDADRWWFAIGSSFKWSDNFQTDVSFAHLHGVHERNIYNDKGAKEGRFRKLDAYLLGLQMVYKF
ncbi:MAG TPA: outer membrane protein transport protein, partial [Candidatus Sutterella merdavium]|nr:outer membrane protein transport protein [Candidatus Sutterella merdavium]